MALDSILDVAKRTVADVLAPGAIAVDATVGNGYDTRFLAQHVGTEGHVYGFDVQEPAIAQAHERLAAAAVRDRVTLIQAGHEAMEAHLPAATKGHVAAIMFNLGYLPGSDKTCITRPDTTVEALKHGIRYLKPGGVVSVVLYTGHEGGAAEAEAVDVWAQALDPSRFRVLSYRFVNRLNDPPRFLAIEKRQQRGSSSSGF